MIVQSTSVLFLLEYVYVFEYTVSLTILLLHGNNMFIEITKTADESSAYTIVDDSFCLIYWCYTTDEHFSIEERVTIIAYWARKCIENIESYIEIEFLVL